MTTPPPEQPPPLRRRRHQVGLPRDPERGAARPSPAAAARCAPSRPCAPCPLPAPLGGGLLPSSDSASVLLLSAAGRGRGRQATGPGPPGPRSQTFPVPAAVCGPGPAGLVSRRGGAPPEGPPGAPGPGEVCGPGFSCLGAVPAGACLGLRTLMQHPSPPLRSSGRQQGPLPWLQPILV